MEILGKLVGEARPFLPTAVAVVGITTLLWLLGRVLERRERRAGGARFRNQLIMIGLTFAGVLVVILVLPIEDSLRGDLLGLIGIILSAAIALSSATLVGNAMAGVMLRAVRNFRMGDFLRVGEHFGRVSERGLFHTEIQTEDRDLTTLPNMYLVGNPVTVIRTSGTIISATVSLGYDVPRKRVEELLLEAAGQTELQDPFVQVLELGDFSVTYRIAGLLAEVKQVISARSRLRCRMLDALHEGGVEIVSPTFMNTRPLAPDRPVIPRAPLVRVPGEAPEEASPESIVFDKADEAESTELLRLESDELLGEVEELRKRLRKAGEGEARGRLERRIRIFEARQRRLARTLAQRGEE